jgi:hypothetical protein
MLYVLVVCSGHLCLPVESVGRYNLTWAECEARMMQTRGADVRCYSNSSSEYWDYDMVLREREPSREIGHPH